MSKSKIQIVIDTGKFNRLSDEMTPKQRAAVQGAMQKAASRMATVGPLAASGAFAPWVNRNHGWSFPYAAMTEAAVLEQQRQVAERAAEAFSDQGQAFSAAVDTLENLGFALEDTFLLPFYARRWQICLAAVLVVLTVLIGLAL